MTGWPVRRMLALSSLTMRELTRVGRALGELEGTGPDDDLLLGPFRRQARVAGQAQGRAIGREEGWREGHAEGRRQGCQDGIEARVADQRALLVRQSTRKFDAKTARQVAQRLSGVRGLAALAEVGDWIIDCPNGDELIERLAAGDDSGFLNPP
ncbi:MAG: hypothetical protein OXF68_03770 [Gammaproteobacteria bacterium]|nr:hypothetical protein [Gammaproteobacteria bacterium]